MESRGLAIPATNMAGAWEGCYGRGGVMNVWKTSIAIWYILYGNCVERRLQRKFSTTKAEKRKRGKG